MGHRARDSKKLVTQFLEATFKPNPVKVIRSLKAFKNRVRMNQGKKILALVCRFSTYEELEDLRFFLSEHKRYWNLPKEDGHSEDPEKNMELLASAILWLWAMSTIDTNQDRYDMILYLCKGYPLLEFFFSCYTKKGFGPEISIFMLSGLRWKTVHSDGVLVEWLAPRNGDWYYNIYCFSEDSEEHHGECGIDVSAEGIARIVLRNMLPETVYIVHIQAKNKKLYLTVPVDLYVKVPKELTGKLDVEQLEGPTEDAGRASGSHVEDILAGLKQLTLLEPGFEDEL